MNVGRAFTAALATHTEPLRRYLNGDEGATDLEPQRERELVTVERARFERLRLAAEIANVQGLAILEDGDLDPLP